MGAQIVFVAWSRLQCICVAAVFFGLCDDWNVRWWRQSCMVTVGAVGRGSMDMLLSSLLSLESIVGCCCCVGIILPLIIDWIALIAYSSLLGLIILLLGSIIKYLVAFMMRYVGLTVSVAML